MYKIFFINEITSIGSVFFKIMDINLFFIIITTFVRFCKNSLISVKLSFSKRRPQIFEVIFHLFWQISWFAKEMSKQKEVFMAFSENLNFNSFVASKPPKFRDFLLFFQLLETRFNWECFCWLTQSLWWGKLGHQGAICYLFNIYEGLVLLKLAETVLILINTGQSNVNVLSNKILGFYINKKSTDFLMTDFVACSWCSGNRNIGLYLGLIFKQNL